MKRFLLIMLMSALAPLLETRAQSKTTYAVGVKTGVTASRFLESNVKNNVLVSYLAGLSLEQRFSPRFSLAYELLYSRQGNNMPIANPGLFDRVRTKYDYVALPIAIRYQLRRYPVWLSPGLQVGYLVGHQTDFLPKNGYSSSDGSSLKKFDVGPTVGLGFRFGKHFTAEAKYFQSLSTLVKSYYGIDPQTGAFIRIAPPESYNQVASISVTYYSFF